MHTPLRRAFFQLCKRIHFESPRRSGGARESAGFRFEEMHIGGRGRIRLLILFRFHFA